MPDKNLTVGMRVLLVGNLYEDPKVEAEFAKPVLGQVGEIVGPSTYDEQWGSRWTLRTASGNLDMSEQDLSPIPDVQMKRTERGFTLGEFTDLYGSKCSIQESSLATQSAIWFGVDDKGHFNMKTPVETGT